jgi:hypothetical protein
MITEQKPIFYSWNSYVADILTNNHKHKLWKDINNIKTGLIDIPCIFNEVDPKIDKHRRRPIGNKNIDKKTVFFCLSHFKSQVFPRNTGIPLSCSNRHLKLLMGFMFMPIKMVTELLMILTGKLNLMVIY